MLAKRWQKELKGKAGERHPILCDLSPAATLIASVYLNPPEPDQFSRSSRLLLDQADQRLAHFWRSRSSEKGGKVEFQIWAEIFLCPLCQEPVVTERVVDATEDIGTAKEFPCPHCGGLVSKAPSKGSNSTRLERTLRTRFDHVLNRPVQYLPRQPIFSQVKIGNQRLKLSTSEAERQYLESLNFNIPFWFPFDELLHGERYVLKDYCPAYGITHIHHLYLPRQLLTYSCLWELANQEPDTQLGNALKFFIQANGLGMTVLNRFGPTHFSQVSRYFSGTLYVPSVVAETSHTYTYENKRDRLVKTFGILSQSRTAHLITTQSCTDLRQIPAQSVDYVFVDPPFGRNLQYSELNQVWEAWLRIRTQRSPEAVMDSTRQREVMELASLMSDGFGELFRVLKPGRWITVVFHNSSNAVWFAIQEAIFRSGLVVADVRTLDRESDTYKQSRQGLVKQDLVISSYKPTKALEQRFQVLSGTEKGAWDFVHNHLR